MLRYQFLMRDNFVVGSVSNVDDFSASVGPI